MRLWARIVSRRREPATRPSLVGPPRRGRAGDRAAISAYPTTGIAVAIALLAALTFSSVLGNGFVFLDDVGNFLNNPDYRGLGWPQLAWAWRTQLMGVYQPLGWMILSAEYAAWGLEPWGYHLVSLLCHAVNAGVFFLVTAELLARARPDLPAGDRKAGAALAAALFAVHPLRAEVVAWASCQPYLPCAMFWLLAILAYLRAHRGERPRRWLLATCWLLALAAMLCKAPAVTLPLVLLVLDFYPLRRLGGSFGQIRGTSARGAWLEKIPFFVLAAVLAVVSVQARSRAFGPESREQDLSRRAALIAYRITFHPVKTAMPNGLTPYRPTPSLRPMNLFEPGSAFRAASVAAVSVALVLLRRRWPGALAAWVAYLIILGPNLGVIPLSDPMITSDRYSYLSTMGSYVVLGAAVAALRSRPALRIVSDGRRPGAGPAPDPFDPHAIRDLA